MVQRIASLSSGIGVPRVVLGRLRALNDAGESNAAAKMPDGELFVGDSAVPLNFKKKKTLKRNQTSKKSNNTASKRPKIAAPTLLDVDSTSSAAAKMPASGLIVSDSAVLLNVNKENALKRNATSEKSDESGFKRRKMAAPTAGNFEPRKLRSRTIRN